MRAQVIIGSLAASVLVIGSLIFVTASSPAMKQQRIMGGIISGYVLDVEGQPVVGAKVYADNNNAPMGRRISVITSEKGLFTFNNLTSGTYAVSASKEQEGYAPSDSTLYSTNFVESPQVSVYEQQIASDVVVHLGPILPKLAGKVSSAVTGKPIRDAQINICRVDMPHACLKTSLNQPDEEGAFELLAPPVAYTLEVSAPGYQPLTEQSEKPHLISGTAKRLNIHLRKK
ncbi:MAG: carboxypeptidase regulatory-like domain-containing protein [Acidobacteria bacterium]|nr:carboxypeptidase regulatory-like domain-containing protein [Acidobacteriota bacterium]